MLGFNDLLNSFFGNYTEKYCINNGLFIAYNSRNEIEAKTRQIIDYSTDIIFTDIDFILGESMVINSNTTGAVNELMNILKANNWDSVKSLNILQGLVLGNTGFKVGVDAKGKVKFDLIKIKDVQVTPTYSSGQIIAWTLEYSIPDGSNGTKNIKEEFTLDFYRREEAGQEVVKAPNKYGKLWCNIIANRPSLEAPQNAIWRGESEWEKFRELVDEINSCHSKLAVMEHRYADPKYIASNIQDVSQLCLQHKLWMIPENADIRILEYSGNVMSDMQERIKMLESALKSKAPELVLTSIENVSGIALKIKLTQFRKKIEYLRGVYFKQFKDLFELIYEIQTQKQAEFEVSASLILPQDDAELLSKLTTLVGMNIVSLDTAAKELGYDYKEEKKKIERESPFKIE